MRNLVLVFLVASLGLVSGINNGVGWLPVMGWSSWNTFTYHINETLIQQIADYMVNSGLKAAGYEYVLMDDGWPLCLSHNPVNGKCTQPAPRTAQGRIPEDPVRFPSGMKALSQYVHDKGLKIGIYTAVSARTCGGYHGSLGYEAIDAQTFADWGMDFVKHDTCNYDCGIHDGCMQRSTLAMRDGLNASGRPIVYYIDSGNPTSPQRVYNPKQYHVSNIEMLQKVAINYKELVWFWAADTAHMFKSWFDIGDSWVSTMDNLHNQVRIAEYQQCGRFNNPDMLTIGQGQQTFGQYRAQFFLWAILGAPLILGADVRQFDAATLSLLTAPEVLAIDQDSDCVQGSFVRGVDATEVWIRPLSDGNFAAVLLNKDPVQTLNVTLYVNDHIQWGDFYPAKLNKVAIRDVYARQDLGVFTDAFVMPVPPMDAAILKVTVLA